MALGKQIYTRVRFKVFMPVAVKNGVFLIFLRSMRRLLVTASVVPMKNGVFWVVTPCGSCKNLIVTAVKTSNLTALFLVHRFLSP
jgi:hypothetical protein